jgi:N utilization substance protein B
MSSKRSQARRHAAQALYQWQVTGDDVGQIVNQFLVSEESGKFDQGYFRELVRGVATGLEELDGHLQPFLDRPVEQIDLVERAVLRLGAYELSHHPEVPYRVVINEAVELAKTFGAEQGHRYVNGVMDRLARALRPHEAAARR